VKKVPDLNLIHLGDRVVKGVTDAVLPARVHSCRSVLMS